MNNKKLIGTIIGVIAFVALIAGATFAWLIVNANITNGIYNLTTKDFVFDYHGGSSIGTIAQVANGNATTTNITSASNASDTTDAWLAVTASKAATSAKASNFELKLHVDGNNLSSNSLLYATCKGNCPANVALATLDGNTATCATGVIKCGIINGGSQTEVQLLNDTTTFNKDSSVNATYNVYFWLNMDTINENDLGKGFSGYIYAVANQGE